MKKTAAFGKTSIAEKVGFGLGGIGYQMTLALTNAFLVLYYTDSVLLSAGFVGTMMLAARVMDGVSDIIMGVVIEKTATRFGKARPWVLVGAVVLAVSMVLMFNVPAGFSGFGKNAYVFITYVLMTVIAYTITALAHTAMLPRISIDPGDRGKVTVVLGLMQGIMTAVLVGVFSPILQALGGESSQRAWTILSLFIAVSSLLLLAVCFVTTKEKISAKAASGDAPKQKISMKEALPFMLGARHFYIIIVLYLVLAVTNGTAGIGVYYMRDVLGDANYMGLFSGITAVAMITAMPFAPKLFLLFGKRKTLLFGLGASVVTKVIMMVFAYNVTVQLVFTFVGSVLIVPVWIGTPNMICDLVDYGDYKRGIRLEGLITSASSFGTKLGAGLGAAILGVALTIGGYDALLPAQTAATKSAIIFIMIGLPGVLCAIGFALMCFWNLEKYGADVSAFMASRSSGKGA